MNKQERAAAMAKGLTPIRAQLGKNSCWGVAEMTDRGGWRIINKGQKKGRDGEYEMVQLCRSMVAENPDKYVDDNE